MKFDYIFYTTDESFDFGDFPGGTCYQTGYHGFSIEINKDNKIDISSLNTYGDYTEMKYIKTLKELKSYLTKHLEEVQEWDENSIYTNLECFKEFVGIIDENIRGKNENNKLQRRYNNQTALCNKGYAY